MKTSHALSIAVSAILCGVSTVAVSSPLSDAMLDDVTAAGTSPALQGSGGAIVGNNSSATLVLTGTLDLSGEAQSGASALNAVNSSESTVANGVNVWDGKLPEGAAPGATGNFEVEQRNDIHQEQRRVALLPEYERTGANRSSTWTEDSTHFSTKTVSTSTEARDVESTSSRRNLTSEGNVDTESLILGQSIKGGQGFAAAGDIGVEFEGGSVVFEASANGEHEDSTLTGDLSLTLTLPQFSVNFNGAGCAVEIGSCDAKGTLKETEETLSDHTVITTVDNTEESEGTFVGGGTKDVRAPFSLEDAQAEYLVLDDSTLDVESNYGVTLAGSAQSNLRALNAVNAAGSAVANAVNISRTPSLTAMASMSLVQSNVIGHSR